MTMHFGDLVAKMHRLDIPPAGEADKPARESVQRVREWLAEGLAHAEFPLDCIELELAAMKERPARGDLEPFFVDPKRGTRFALAYWAPGREAGAHEHNDWTVTAVFHNALDVETYDWDAARSERKLKVKNVHHAEKGRVGYIYDPCIHNPRNPTKRWSMSIHVVSPNDGPKLEKEVGPIDGLYTIAPAEHVDPGDPLLRLLREKSHQLAYRVQAEVLVQSRSTRAEDLLRRIYERADSETKRVVALELAARDTSGATDWLREARSHEVGPDTDVVRAWPAIALSVARSDTCAELVSLRGNETRLLLRLNAWAADALVFVARAGEFRTSELPRLAPRDQVALTRALVDLGLFQVVPHFAARGSS
jgi:hypothetical protein